MSNVTVKGRRVTALKYGGKDEPGDFAWVNSDGEPAPPHGECRMVFCCPCGCGGYGATPVRRGGSKTRSPEWDWDGERDEPTLTPSVWFNKDAPGDWHGWLRQGTWEGC